MPPMLAPGTDWVLIGPAAITGEVTLRFEPGSLSGAGPVNRYFGPFAASEDGRLAVGAVGSTKMAGPADLMASEQRYFELLSRVDRFEADGIQLTLLAGDEALLDYAVPDSAAAFGPTLVGLSVAKARNSAKAEGFDFRVISVDGVGRPVTLDYRPDRLNVTVVDDVVTQASAG